MPDDTRPSQEPAEPAATAVARDGWRANLQALAAAVASGGRRPHDEVPEPAYVNPLRRSEEQRSLFGEILDWMLAPLLLVWPMSVTITYLAAQNVANAPFDRTLADSATRLARHVEVRGNRVVLDLPHSASEVLRAESTDTVYYIVLGLRGEFITGDRDLPIPPDDEVPQLGRVKLRDVQFNGTPLRAAWTWVDPRRADARPVLVQVAETLDQRAQLANEIIRGVIVPQFVVLPITVALVWFGLTRGLAPLNLLLRRIRARRPDDLSPIDKQAAPEELAPLVEAFNELLLRLARNAEAQKRFVAHAAHQMKTPLAGLRTQAELALREVDPQQLRRSLRQIAGSTERAAHLIDQLLALARAEHEATDLGAFEAVDLGALARERVRERVPEALDKGLDLGFEAPAQPVRVIGLPMLLRELVSNLLDNALRYTPAGGRVTVRVGATADTIGLEVEDTGPGIPQAERHLVFERFYRVLGTNIDGSGLGLAIVREIAGQHDARLRIGSNPRAAHPQWPGTLIGVEFPNRLNDLPAPEPGLPPADTDAI